MLYQSVFKRYEIKFLLSLRQKERILSVMEPHMAPDRYALSRIRNVYLDTGSYRIIRNSIERPPYKEKLRLRSYEKATPESEIFVELKKKYNRVVYKRRVVLPEASAEEWLLKGAPCEKNEQITREIDYFKNFYGMLFPSVFLSYRREAFCCPFDRTLRITFDNEILARCHNVSLCEDVYGEPLLSEDTVLMEVKCDGGMPLWLVRHLSEERIYKTTFSKYGTAYKTLVFPNKCK